jgi:hypothetical protein
MAGSLLRHRNDLLLPSVQKSIGTDDKRTNAVQCHVGKRRFDLLLGSGIEPSEWLDCEEGGRRPGRQSILFRRAGGRQLRVKCD